jgi:hypothetical protein
MDKANAGFCSAVTEQGDAGTEHDDREIGRRVRHAHSPGNLHGIHEDERAAHRSASTGGSSGDIDFKLIRCRIATELGKTPEEAGAIDFPDVMDLLDYWLEYPPTHLLVRGLAGYKGKQEQGNWRSKRAEEMGDMEYTPEPKTEKEQRIASEFVPKTGSAKHLDCAPPHVQQAIERAKLGKHLEVPQPE